MYRILIPLLVHVYTHDMHELAIAKSILDTVQEERTRLGLDDVEGVAVRVGGLSGVLPEALKFSFDAIRTDTDLEQCQLSIERVPITIRCETCGCTSEVENFLFSCPACSSSQVTVITGYELEIAYLEISDDAPSPFSIPNETNSNGRPN